MKQYTSPEQTAKLIELGFEKPKNTQYIQRAKARNLHSPFIEFGEPEFEGSYSIGELIEMLPLLQTDVDNEDWPLSIEAGCNLECPSWFVYYMPENIVEKPELIDALYEMAVKLKEEGII